MDEDTQDHIIDINDLDQDVPSRTTSSGASLGHLNSSSNPVRSREPANGPRSVSAAIEIDDSDDDSPSWPSSPTPVPVPAPTYSTAARPHRAPRIPKAPQRHKLHDICAPSSFAVNPYMERFCDAQVSSVDILMQDLNKANKTGNPLKSNVPPNVVTSIIERAEVVSKELKKILKRLSVYRKGGNWGASLDYEGIDQRDTVVQLAVEHTAFITLDPKHYVDLTGRDTYKARAGNLTVIIERMEVAARELQALKVSLIDLSHHAEEAKNRKSKPGAQRARNASRPSTRKKPRMSLSQAGPAESDDELFLGASRRVQPANRRGATGREGEAITLSSDDSDDHNDSDLDEL